MCPHALLLAVGQPATEKRLLECRARTKRPSRLQTTRDRQEDQAISHGGSRFRGRAFENIGFYYPNPDLPKLP